jgi:hypothetical protein
VDKDALKTASIRAKAVGSNRAYVAAAKGSKSQLMALTARVDQFGDEAPTLSRRIQEYWAVAAEGT